jgi:dihydroceramidase
MSAAGLWGPVTSTVDWCEPNYLVSRLVAEPFNTVSSAAMIAAGLTGLLRHRRTLPARYLAAFALLVLVGAGSAAFHATLKFELQLLDELPMLYLVLLIVWILRDEGARPSLLGAALATWGALLTLLNAFVRGDVQFWLFQLSFGSLELFSLASVIRLHLRDPSRAGRLFRLGMAAYAVAIAVWFVDIRFCAWLVPYVPLHALWHVLVSMGFYALLLVIAAHRLTAPAPAAPPPRPRP